MRSYLFLFAFVSLITTPCISQNQYSASLPVEYKHLLPDVLETMEMLHIPIRPGYRMNAPIVFKISKKDSIETVFSPENIGPLKGYSSITIYLPSIYVEALEGPKHLHHFFVESELVRQLVYILQVKDTSAFNNYLNGYSGQSYFFVMKLSDRGIEIINQYVSNTQEMKRQFYLTWMRTNPRLEKLDENMPPKFY
jgi:hypothetical protein